MRIASHTIEVSTDAGIAVYDITPEIRGFVQQDRIGDGLAVITSRHTTTALAVNEFEERLVEDIRRFFSGLVPAERPWLHNDIHLRDCPPDEPRNAHSHLVAMLLSHSEVIPVVAGELQLGTWESVLFLELDGPRSRGVNLQLLGQP